MPCGVMTELTSGAMDAIYGRFKFVSATRKSARSSLLLLLVLLLSLLFNSQSISMMIES